MCRVLNMSEFWIFVNFRKYDKVLNMCRDIIKEGREYQYSGFPGISWNPGIPWFRVCQVSAYASVAQGKVLNMPEFAWIMPNGRVLNMLGQRSMAF